MSRAMTMVKQTVRKRAARSTGTKATTSLDGLARKINQEHEAAEKGVRESLHHAHRAGVLLLEVKAKLDHGKFMDWVAQHCGFSHATAVGYMRVAGDWEKLDWKIRELEAKSDSQCVTNLTLRGALDLLREKPPGWNTKAASDDQPTQAVAPLLSESRRYIAHLQRALQMPPDRLRPHAEHLLANFAMVRTAIDTLQTVLTTSEVRAA